MNSCEEMRLFWNEHASGELLATQSDAVRSHLGACGRCAEGFRMHTELIARVDRALEPLKTVRRPTRGTHRPWLLNAAVAAALVVAVFGAVLPIARFRSQSARASKRDCNQCRAW